MVHSFSVTCLFPHLYSVSLWKVCVCPVFSFLNMTVRHTHFYKKKLALQVFPHVTNRINILPVTFYCKMYSEETSFPL